MATIVPLGFFAEDGCFLPEGTVEYKQKVQLASMATALTKKHFGTTPFSNQAEEIMFWASEDGAKLILS